MAQFPGLTPQVTDPALLNEIVDRLIIRGQLGELPVNPVVNLVYQLSEGNWVRDEGSASITATDPGANALIADTGALSGGVYNFTWGWSAKGPIVDWEVLVDFRTEDNSGSRDSFIIQMDADANQHRNFVRRKVIEGERLRLQNLTDLSLAGGMDVTGWILWTRLF